MQKKVLLAFDDPGGGLAVSSLIESLNDKGFDLSIYSGKLSKKLIDKSDVKDLNSNISKDEAEDIFLKNLPDILITGTSAGNAEQELRNTAYKKNISSVVVLDFWKDYSRRWLYADYPVEQLKDIVCVMDDLTKKEMLEEKFPDGKLVVTGHPYLNKIFNYQKEKIVNEHASKNNFLFLSQPLSIIGIKDYKVHPFRILLEAFKKYSSFKKETIHLIVKLHPSEENKDELTELMNDHNTDSLKIEFADQDSDLKDLLKDSEIVFGYNTIAMFESRAINKRTISLNVVPVRESLQHAMLTAGIEIVECNERNILDCLTKANTPVNVTDIFQNGILNCTEIISKELSTNNS